MNDTLELTQALVLVLTAIAGFLVTNGLKALFPKADISGVAARVTAGVVTSVIALINFGLSYVPAQFHDPVLALFGLIVSILGAAGIHYTIKTRNASTSTGKSK